MSFKRRDLLGQIGLAGALLPLGGLPTFARGQANPDKVMSKEEAHGSADHRADMQRVLGERFYANEQIAMLLYPGFTALDLVGPHYFFASLFGAKVHLVTTESALTPVRSDLGLAIEPTITMRNCPENLDVFFVPGGTQGTLDVMGRDDVMRFIALRGRSARLVTSVCTGSMILAHAALLQGKRATSHWAVRSVLADFGAIPVDERIVADGNLITGAGVSAGLDFGIAVTETLRGRPYAAGLMLQAEYWPQPPFPGGIKENTSSAVYGMMESMFLPLQDKFRRFAGRAG